MTAFLGVTKQVNTSCSCGTTAKPNDIFCRNCGSSLSPGSMAKDPRHPPLPNNSNETRAPQSPSSVYQTSPTGQSHYTNADVSQGRPKNSMYQWLGGLGAIAVVIALKVGPIAYNHVFPASGTSSAAVQSAHPLQPRLRIFSDGDRWEYTVSGEMTANGQTAELQNGKVVIRIFNVTSAANPTYEDETTLSGQFAVEGKTVPFSSIDHHVYSQDHISATTMLLSDDDGPNHSARKVVSSSVDTPGTWSSNLNTATTTNFDNGDNESSKMIVTGTEVISTPAGRFATYVMSKATSSSDGSQDQQIMRIAPQVGQPVEGTLTRTSLDGTTMSLHMTLVKTNVIGP